MARKVKCQVTGQYGTTDTFSKINGKYYASKEIYDNWQSNINYRQKVIDKICFDFLNYEKGQVFPTALTKKLKELDFYGYEVIFETIQRSEKNIEYALTVKEFKNDSSKISYLMAIVKNNINDVYKELQRNERKAMLFIEEDTQGLTDIQKIQSKQQEKDIRKWLEEDEWI